MGNPETNAERLAAVIEEIDPSVILVDYLETLVTRSITGKQVKRVTARFLRERFQLEANLDEIHRCRLDVEAELRRAAESDGRDPEHRIDDVADGMWARIGAMDGRGRPIQVATFREAAIAIELSVERAAQAPDSDIIAALRSVAATRRLMLVCDFPLPSPWIGEMLTHHGIDDLFEQVFVSGDHGVSRASGRLITHVLETVLTGDERATLGTSAGPCVLTVGAHPISDGKGATELGLATCLIERPPPPRLRRVQRRLARSNIARRRALRSIVAQQPEGFGELAVTLYAFARALHGLARADDVERLTFLAREGRILRSLFITYDATSPAVAERHIDTEYLIVSRRSTYLPALRPLDDEDFSRLIALYPKLTSADLLANLGLEAAQQRSVLAEMCVSGDDGLDLDELRRSTIFRQLYTEGRDQQRDLLCRLVDQLIGDGAPLHVVDVGWKGTMQDHLQTILGSSRTITGYYLGIVPGRHMFGEGTKFGVLFDGRAVSTPAQRTLRHFKSIYEFLLQADHGSARRYVEKAGAVVAELDDQDLEAQVYVQHIGPVQQQLDDMFRHICSADAISETPLVGSLNEVARLHQRMLFFPTRREIDRILAIRHYENFGPLGFAGTPEGGDGLRRDEKLRRVMSMLRQPKSLAGQGWPPLTLVAVGLGPLVPVVGTYRWMRSRLSAIASRRRHL